MSAHRHGVAFVPLFEAHPSAVSKTDSRSVCQSHLLIVVRSRSSRSRSPSHQTPKLHDRGFRSETFSPFTFHTPERPGPDAHISYPGCRGSMSIATPRLTSGLGLLQS